MKLLVRFLTAACLVTLAVPALAQNPGGLPGEEHLAAGVAFKDADRVVLHGNVVHYWFDLSVGPGPFDTIRLHRVVKESQPGRPDPKMEGVLLLPGSPTALRVDLPSAGRAGRAPSRNRGSPDLRIPGSAVSLPLTPTVSRVPVER